MRNYNASRRVRSLAESVCTGFVGHVPWNLGRWLRAAAYGRLLGGCGERVSFEPNVAIAGTAAVFIAASVFLGPGAFIDAGGSGASGTRITLGQRARLRRDVWLDATGRDNLIEIGAAAFLGWGVRFVSSGSRSRISIGAGSFIDRGVDVRAHDDGVIEIGEQTYLGPYVCAAGPGRLRIGNNCLIASHASLYANDHCFDDPVRLIKDQGNTTLGITIGDDCWIGSGARILDGVTIGDGCVVGAGAVVTRSLPPRSVAVGVPARVIRTRAAHDPPRLTIERIVQLADMTGGELAAGA